jgi:hypothetical protein
MPAYLPSQLFDRLFYMTGEEGYFKIKKDFLEYVKTQASGSEVLNLCENLRVLASDIQRVIDTATKKPAKETKDETKPNGKTPASTPVLA